MFWYIEIMFTTAPYQSRQDRQAWYAKGGFCDKDILLMIMQALEVWQFFSIHALFIWIFL